MLKFRQYIGNLGYSETIRSNGINPFTLSFRDKVKNDRFLTFYYNLKINYVRIALIVGVIVYSFFYLLDMQLLPGVSQPFVTIRFYILLPFVILIILFSYTAYFRKFFQFIISLAIFIAGAGIIAMIFITNEAILDNYYVGIILVAHTGYVFIGLRFVWSAITNWLIALLYLYVAVYYRNFSDIVLLTNVIFIFTANFLGMITAYLLEYFTRRNYCLQNRLEETNRKVKRTNEYLEEEVEARTEQLRESFEKLQKESDEKRQLNKEQKNLHKQLIQSQKMEAIGLLAGGIAHDFNNLLTVINGYSELLLIRHKNDKENEIITQIYNTGKKAEALTGQLLAFSRKQVMKSVPVNLNILIKDIEMMLRHLVGENIDIIFIYDKEDVKILADPGQLEQVMVNLIINARDAMPDGGIIKVSTEIVASDDLVIEDFDKEIPPERICLSITDSGVGMDSDVLNHIFEPFYTKKEEGKGTGLGLSTVYGIVKQSGGYIRVSSKVNRGTTFKIYFDPYYGNGEEDQIIQEDISEKLTDNTKKVTILFVEDEDSVREYVEYILKDSGYFVYSACNGEEGYEKFLEHKKEIDLLITDVIMPGFGGKELVDKILEISPDKKYVYISGYTDDVLGKHGILSGEINLIQKPFTREYFLSKITKVITKNGVDTLQ